MSGAITINLPLKAYLVKYLTKKYGNQHIVTRNSWLGSYFIELLDKQFRKSGNIKDGPYYKLIIPREITRTNGFDMPPVKFNKLEKMIDKLFRNDLYSYVQVTIENELYVRVNKSFFSDSGELVMHKQDVMKAMKQFLKTHKINEDDLKLESIYRDYTRYLHKSRTKITNTENTAPVGSVK